MVLGLFMKKFEKPEKKSVLKFCKFAVKVSFKGTLCLRNQ
jgi:hypothetical protein